ncbi:hypothetical protein CDV31_013961 [Fusarium ambrosium]|uniref:Uncharacterized protein n=1 Tax=Fusarium ambrosium TaxID=131363 RepID=A0A428SZP6_9HYPO|nr:hypothetical protein CDV31_013961 [Fusarium ambrosium]
MRSQPSPVTVSPPTVYTSFVLAPEKKRPSPNSPSPHFGPGHFPSVPRDFGLVASQFVRVASQSGAPF